MTSLWCVIMNSLNKMPGKKGTIELLIAIDIF